ncbi:MAG: ABC transporter ATP-binding protein [Bacteroidia bacterium]|nr:ABC transporter ATP-binding protein [Bacteroidia bacterium]
MKPILEVKEISKRFRIYHESRPYLTFREQIQKTFISSGKKTSEDFWALRNISFTVSQGESLGIIGRNGAGKSTLLKILSRITPPTTGGIVSRGRIASLLEVGTGFHPELTGQENIFLNGSILGMKQAEIKKKFDAILDFSGVEKFIDTPLKHYSSGMQLRLAFAVAAFLEPEILIIDEVLAVGDAEFQKKCIRKMEGVARSGHTILFVSHQMGLVKQLCNRCILLDKGIIAANDSSEKVTSMYLNLGQQEAVNRYEADAGSSTGKKYFFTDVQSVNPAGEAISTFGFNQPICLKMNMQFNQDPGDILLSVGLLDKFGNRVFTVHRPLKEFLNHPGRVSGTLKIPANLIAPNYYTFHFALVTRDGTVFDQHESKCLIQVADTGTVFSEYEGKDYGSIILDCEWI